MKRINYLLVIITALSFTIGCKNADFRKTKSGLVYKLFPGKGKDSLIRAGQVVKFNYTIKFNDSLMDQFNSYGKMPGFIKVQPSLPNTSYDFRELLTMMKKGDSVVTVQMADTILKSYQELMQLLPPHAKKGDRLTMAVKIENVFSVDSIAMADFKKEKERDMPRAMKEQQEQMAKAQKEELEKENSQIAEVQKSGEADKEIKQVEAYLATRKIKAQKTGNGTFVEIKEQGTGPAAAEGKWVNVKYTGKVMATDSTFQSNAYAFQLGLGKGGPIRGWQEGLLLFKQGGKGTLYIPGFLAYANSPNSPFKPYEALKFDVELLQVSDQPINNQPQPQPNQ
ncbi:MAG: FKBP-type peptidyl-prolyl cis-trans isomerase [Bacteroidota bacterium]|nr:FKBP-type peptidyl-prolyl cis-trans isomerase [Bacteroidota bacterium]